MDLRGRTLSDDVTLHLGDCTAILPTLPDASVDCVITDPPYPEIDRDYGRMSEADWHAMMDVVVPECRRILKPTGSAVFVLQPNSERVGRMRPWLWEFMAKWTREWGMVQDAWWWNYAALTLGGANTKGMLRASIKPCVWLGPENCYRDQSAVFWSPAKDTLTRKSVERFRRDYPCGVGVTQSRSMGTPRERNGSTPYNLFPIRGVSAFESCGHSAQTPIDLCDWWLRYICPPGGMVMDPFIGSGTVGIAAVKRGCGVVGIERMPAYHAIARDRIAKAQAAKSELLVFA